MSDNRLFSGLNGLRAIACLSVILSHVFLTLDYHVQGPLLQFLFYFFWKIGIGVSIFFVLSGFLLSYPFWERYLSNREFPDIKDYAVKRAARIMPGYYAALIVSLIVVYAFHQPMEYAVRRIVTAFTFTSGFHYTTFFSSRVDAPLWSVSFEVFSYVLMPIFFFLIFRATGRRSSFLKGVSCWIAVFALMIALNHFIHVYFTPDNADRGWQYGIIGGAKAWMPGYNPVGLFGHFIFGILAAGITSAISRNEELKSKLTRMRIFDIAVPVLILAIIAMVILVPAEKVSLQLQPYYFPSVTILIMLLVVSLVNSVKAGKILDCRFLNFTGKISFGLYIWHYIIINLISFTVYPAYTNDQTMKNWSSWLAINAGMMVTAYIVATVSFYFLEKPFLDKVHTRVRAVKLSAAEE